MRDDSSLIEALTRRLTAVLGNPVTVGDLDPVSMGASKAIWRFTATSTGGGSQRLVLRADPVEAPKPDAMAFEAAVLRAAHEQGVRVPEVIDAGDGVDGIGSPFVIMTCVEGETLPPRILRDPATDLHRVELTRDLGRAIGGIHQIPLDIAGVRRIDDVAEFEATYRQGTPSPAMELGWRWLHGSRPQAHAPVVVHGDFRHGNLIIEDGRLAAVLDWELAHVGDPLEDLGWVCTKAWRFGAAHPVGGFGQVDDLLDGYADVTGWRPEPRDVLWWSIYGSVRWGIMCRRQAARHLEGDEQSLELALIGRRFAENELDVLTGLGLFEPGAFHIPAEAPAAGRSMFGTPTIGDILDAAIEQTSRSAEYRDRLLKSALNVVHRELALGPRLNAELDQALSAVGYESEIDLAAAIRAGAPLDAALLDAVRVGVVGRVAVWNPKYLGYPAPGSEFRLTSADVR